MAELAKEHGKLNAELKDMDEVERRAKSHELFKEFKYKIGAYGYKLYKEEEISEVIDDDRERSATGQSGLTYCDVDHSDGLCYVMMKEKEEYPRIKLLFDRLEAAGKLTDKTEKEKEKYVKILLGEV
jgi:hypothetical protein